MLSLDTSAYEKNADSAKQTMQAASKSMQQSASKAGSGAENIAKQFAAAAAKAHILATAVVSVAEKAASIGSSLVNAGLQYNMQMEKYQTAFTNMLGSAEKAASALQQIKEDAARTPLNVASLVQANQLLISAGVDAGEARKTILALGDAVSAAGGGNAELSRMAQNLQQIKNVGEAASIDIKQFAYAGIDVYGILSDYTGKSTAEVQKMTISYDLLTQALQAASEEGGRYYNAMETQSQTLSGRIETLKDNWSQLIGSLTEGLTDAEGKLVSAAAGWVQTLQTSFEEYGANGLMEAGSSIVNDIANGIADRIPQLSEQAGAAVQRFSEYLIENMGTVVETGGNLLSSLAEGILNALPEIADAAVQTVGALASELFANADKIFEQGAKLIGKLCEGLLSVLGNVIEAAGNVVEAIVTKIFTTDWVQVGKDIVSSIGQGIQNGISAISGPLDRLSYKLNHALGKNGYAEYDTFEAWAAANGKTSETKYQQGSQKNDGYWKRYGNKLAQQYGLNEKGADAGSNGSGTTTGGSSSGSSGKKSGSGTKSTTETVISSISHTATTTAQNALGTVTTSIQTLTEKVKDSAGKIKDRVTTTTTETGKEMVNGVATTYKQVETKVDGVVTKVTKTYDDMSKTLLGTFTNVAETTFNGITTKIQQATEKYADGSEHVKKTVTETGERIGENGAETYEKIITYIDGIEDKTTETATAIDKSVKATQSRIDGYLSGASGQLDKGVLGLFKSFISDTKNGDWGNLGLDFVNLIWGEVSQGQRETISKWADDALDVINEAYSGGGLSKAFETLKQLFGDGIVASADGVSKDVKSFGEIFKGLTGEVTSNGSQIISVLTKIGTAMGGFVTSTGEGIAGLASSLGGLGGVAQGLGGVFTQLGSLIMSNPEIAAIIAIVAGVAALGAAIWAIFGRKKNENKDSTSKLSYKDLQDAYWYGNERAFAGYDFRTDPYTFNPNNSAVLGYQTKMQEQLAKLTDVVQQYLPDVANQQIVLDDGTLVGKMAPGMDAQLGQLAVLAERGN